eukprot:SAG31_NODE_431_length_15775_cov_3.350663_16_plen_124_part_00
MVALCEMLHDESPGGAGTRSFRQTHALLDERLRLMREEGVAEAWAHGAMFAVMAKAGQAPDGGRDHVKQWCDRALTASNVILGTDCVQSKAYPAYAKRLLDSMRCENNPGHMCRMLQIGMLLI